MNRERKPARRIHDPAGQTSARSQDGVGRYIQSSNVGPFIANNSFSIWLPASRPATSDESRRCSRITAAGTRRPGCRGQGDLDRSGGRGDACDQLRHCATRAVHPGAAQPRRTIRRVAAQLSSGMGQPIYSASSVFNFYPPSLYYPVRRPWRLSLASTMRQRPWLGRISSTP